jgi:hypothetical protein
MDKQQPTTKQKQQTAEGEEREGVLLKVLVAVVVARRR